MFKALSVLQALARSRGKSLTNGTAPFLFGPVDRKNKGVITTGDKLRPVSFVARNQEVQTERRDGPTDGQTGQQSE